MIYGYIRVSTKKQDTENQKFEILKFAQSRQIKIDQFIEETISGTKSYKDRKLGELLNTLKKGDTIITSESLGYKVTNVTNVSRNMINSI